METLMDPVGQSTIALWLHLRQAGLHSEGLAPLPTGRRGHRPAASQHSHKPGLHGDCGSRACAVGLPRPTPQVPGRGAEAHVKLHVPGCNAEGTQPQATCLHLALLFYLLSCPHDCKKEMSFLCGKWPARRHTNF